MRQEERNFAIILVLFVIVECIPPSLRFFSGNEQVDLARKMQEDPLYAIKKKEIETRNQLLKNPVKLKQLRELVSQCRCFHCIVHLKYLHICVYVLFSLSSNPAKVNKKRQRRNLKRIAVGMKPSWICYWPLSIVS